MEEMTDYEGCRDNNARFAVLLRQVHAKLLKPQGFKKDGQTFRRLQKNGDLTQGAILAFQRSAYNDQTELRFTVNLGRKAVVGALDPKFKVYDCGLQDQTRLPILAKKYGYDKWWSVMAETELPALEQELLHLIREDAFPWLRIKA